MTTTTTRTSGQAFGSAIGSTAAHIAHFAALSGTGIGRFAADTVDGVAVGYVTTAAVRSEQRLQRAAAREALLAPQRSIAVAIA